MKDPMGSGMVEADITINGRTLSFAESMTLRVALGSFATYVNDLDTAKQLGSIAQSYSHHCDIILDAVHKKVR